MIARLAALGALFFLVGASSLPAQPPAQRPNVVVIVFDDAGFADIGAFGSELRTPNIDKLAANGLRYTQFHTTSLCSPSRAALLTGRNHHTVGMRTLANFATGAPNNLGRITPAAATLAEMLREHGYNTFAVGKWHLLPPDETTPAGPFTDWPLSRGFDRYYGFLDGGTDQFYPELVEDNHRVDPPRSPRNGYHLTEDLVTRAIDLVRDQQAARADKPFLLYLSLSAPHAPHQVPREYIERNRGRFDRGWDVIRAERLERMKRLGILPAHTALAPRGPGIKAWNELSADERRLFARFQETYAGFMEHTDEQIGRLTAFLEQNRLLDNTLLFLLSDNGASQEGALSGTTNQMSWPNRMPRSVAQNLEHLDEIGGLHVHANYPLGWAQVSNTPFQRFKQNVHFGGVRDPLIVHWPARIRDRGGIRSQFHHLIDVVPTVLDVLGKAAPATYRGVPQLPVAGITMAYSFANPRAPSARKTQYFEMSGHRGIYSDGWKAVTFHVKGTPFDSDRWELYNISEDFSETRDLASRHPEKVRELEALWFAEAKRYGVLPLDDRNVELRLFPRPGAPARQTRWVFDPGMPVLASGAAPDVLNRSYTITADIERSSRSEEGVLIAHGDVDGGYVLYVKENRLVHEYNYLGTIQKLQSDADLPIGAATVRFEFVKTGEHQGLGRMFVQERKVAEGPIPHTVPNIISFGPLSVGRDALSPVSASYRDEGEFPFATGLKRVVIELIDTPR